MAALITLGLVSYGVIANRTVAGVPEPAMVSSVSASGRASTAFALPHLTPDRFTGEVAGPMMR